LVDAVPERQQEPRFRRHISASDSELAVGRHTAIPRTDSDTSDPNFLQAIANTAAFHSPRLSKAKQLVSGHGAKGEERGGAADLISIGPTERCIFRRGRTRRGMRRR
jgi:hypothetical protein